jgi:hypothetical protein
MRGFIAQIASASATAFAESGSIVPGNERPFLRL